jgi:hypothetical protein
MTRIVRGQMVAMFAFDVGYEVSLEQLATLFSATPVHPLSRKRQTPSYLQYTKPPLTLSLETSRDLLEERCSMEATVFDFGAVSIAYRWPLAAVGKTLPLEDLPRLSNQLYNRNLEAHAREQVVKLMGRIGPAIVRSDLSRLTEDYYLFIIEQLEEPMRAEELLLEYGSMFAQVLSFETLTLSRQQQEDALSQRISYSEADLTVVDWNAAIICDPDYEDTARVLELLNVELLEARYIDEQLDQRITEYAALVHKRPEWPLPLRTPYRLAIQQLTELRIEATLLDERVGNSLKLIGDLFLSRVHSAAAARVHLPEWERIIFHKLEIIDNFYQLLNDRVRTIQSQTLELAIMAVIVVELFLALFK